MFSRKPRSWHSLDMTKKPSWIAVVFKKWAHKWSHQLKVQRAWKIKWEWFFFCVCARKSTVTWALGDLIEKVLQNIATFDSIEWINSITMERLEQCHYSSHIVRTVWAAFGWLWIQFCRSMNNKTTKKKTRKVNDCKYNSTDGVT